MERQLLRLGSLRLGWYLVGRVGRPANTETNRCFEAVHGFDGPDCALARLPVLVAIAVEKSAGQWSVQVDCFGGGLLGLLMPAQWGFYFDIRGRPSSGATTRDGGGKGAIDCGSNKIDVFVIDNW